VAQRVLLFESTAARDERLGLQLAQAGFVVQRASDDRGAAPGAPPDLAVLRAEGQTDGWLSRSLGRLSGIPAVVICPAHDEDLIVGCLEAGADRVLVEPVSRRELAARLHAAAGSARRAGPPAQRDGRYYLGDLVIDTGVHRATKGGLPLALTPTEFRLLVALARRAGETVPYLDLISEVWAGADAEHAENLRLYVHYLREKLGDDAGRPRLIVNERGAGYRLCATRGEA